MYLIDDIWLEIKSFLLLEHKKWLFNMVLKELPKAQIEKHLSTYKRVNDDYAIVKHFEKINYFQKDYSRFSAVCSITKKAYQVPNYKEDGIIFCEDVTAI